MIQLRYVCILVLSACLPLMTLADSIPAASARYKLDLRRQAQYIWGLDAPTASFAAQIHQESRWRTDAVSRTGARGLAQFMPATADWISGMDKELRTNQPANPTWALRALVTYDKWLYQRVKGANHCERMAFAMSAYNGGLGWVNKRKAKSGRPLHCFDATCNINPGITAGNQRENSDYPRRILLRAEPMYEAANWGPGSCP